MSRALATAWLVWTAIVFHTFVFSTNREVQGLSVIGWWALGMGTCVSVLA